MSIFVIGGLVFLGLLLIVVEFVVIPGITFAGIAGLLLMIVANYFAFADHGPKVGGIILLITIVANIIGTVLILRKKTWSRIGLKSAVSGRTNTYSLDVKVGDQGVAVSRLAPSGKAMINDKLYEVATQGSFLDQDAKVEVILIKYNKIIVKQVL